MAVPELEISLRQGGGRRYEVELRFWRGDDSGDVRRAGLLAPAFAPTALPSLRDDAEAYGRALGAALLSDPDVKAGFSDAELAAGDESLRVRLLVNPNAAGLADLAWEAARHPDTGALLFAGDRRIFSRFSASADARALHRRARSALRILLAVASPKDIGQYAPDDVQLEPIEEDTEVKRVVEALPGTERLVTLRSSEAPVTLPAIVRELARDVDVFYLVCHGALIDGSPTLYLDAESGAATATSSSDFVHALGNLRTRPRLVILASCRSGGAGPDRPYGAGGALSAMATRLTSEAGIPAIIAMQGDVSLETVNAFVAEFFDQLANDGVIDRAMSMARSAVGARADWWAPVLLTRLRTGELWYRSGFAAPEAGFTLWPALRDAIRERKCTPILGPALLERLIGPRRDLAVELAQRYNLPTPLGERDLLAFIAQYRAVEQSPESVRRDLLFLLVEQVRRRFGDQLPPALSTPPDPNAQPEVLVALVRDALVFAASQEKDDEPHALLARLPFPLFVTANPDSVLEDALTNYRKEPPVVESNSWSLERNQGASIFDTDKNYRPSFDRPFVYHFFGRAEEEDSVAITQDQFLDSLISAARIKAVPDPVRAALTRNTLLFLGFQHDDWAFRTLFRFINKLEGGSLLRKRKHVAVQLDPDDQTFDDPRIAQRYLARYLGEEQITLYWGRVDEFIRQLTDQVNAPGAAQ